MKKITALSALMLTSIPAMAAPAFNTVPEPGVLSLLGAGVVALLITRRMKK
ncbi:PEP-CTERM sorting domain-containing protein [Neptunomonas sp.]|uniref:PEP-CTERM sorting domain-containing protein n=1 Tax=Neptunomonas sp. TaxID=1971898 RepID=UPI0025EEEE0B|nr:PEP-CTERM sorting domain-containing protein [Neptunomonas sp.]